MAQKSYGTKNPTPVSAQRPGLGELLNDQELKLPHDSFSLTTESAALAAVCREAQMGPCPWCSLVFSSSLHPHRAPQTALETVTTTCLVSDPHLSAHQVSGSR